MKGQEEIEFILALIFLFGIMIAPQVLINWLWRRKYVHKGTGWKKCGVCGRVPDPVVVEEGFLFTKYFCKEHSSINRDNKKKKKRYEKHKNLFE